MNLTIRNIPQDVMAKLKAFARSARRSLNSEILVRLEESVKENPAAIRNDPKSQIDALRELCGAWVDDRETADIIKDIYASRTMGRPVD